MSLSQVESLLKQMLDDVGIDLCFSCRNDQNETETYISEEDGEKYPRCYRCDECICGGGENYYYEYKHAEEIRRILGIE